MRNWGFAVALSMLVVGACDPPPSSVADADDTGNDDGPGTDDGDPPGDGDGDSTDQVDAGPPDAPSPDAGPGDLTINPGRAIADMAIGTQLFTADSCELDPDEDCVAAPGARRLLYFAVETPNIGDNDVFLGRPSADNPNFVYSSCHEHYHFLGFAEYALVDADDNEIAVGRKQAFCLVDSGPYLPGAPTRARYSCGYQGIQAGWSDVYAADLPCQFLDITDVPDGDYELVLRVNTGDLLPETRRDNNEARIPLSIGAAALETPTEDCPELDDHSSKGLHRECGWDRVATFACEPGARVDLGCAAQCGVGSCSGDPMIRVCDGGDGASGGEPNCTNQNKLGADENACGSLCPRASDVICPNSGSLVVYAAPERVGGAYTCDVAVRE